MSPRKAKRKTYSGSGEKVRTRAQTKLMNAISQEHSSTSNQFPQVFSGKPVACPASSFQAMGQTENTLSHCVLNKADNFALLRKSSTFDEADSFSSHKTVDEDEPQRNSFRDKPSQPEAVIANITLSPRPNEYCSGISLRYPHQFGGKRTYRLAVRGEKVECSAVETVDRFTIPSDPTNVGQIPLDFTAKHEAQEKGQVDVPEQVLRRGTTMTSNAAEELLEEDACSPSSNIERPCQTLATGLMEMATMGTDNPHEKTNECNRNGPSSAPTHNLRAVNPSSSASGIMPTEQVPILEAIAASNPAGERVEGNSCNSNINNAHPSQAMSVGLTEVASLCAEDNSDDEVEFPALVTVQAYRVLEKFAPTLRKIIEKHGDIASNCTMETPRGRSLILEGVCEIIQTFQVKKFYMVAPKEIEQALDLVRDFERSGVNVAWLKKSLEEILETRKLLKQSKALKEVKDKSNQLIIEKRRQVLKLQEELSLARNELDTAQMECDQIKEKVSNAMHKVGKFMKHPVLDNLL